MLDRIKNDLEANYRDDEDVLKGLIEDYTSIASDVTNRKPTDSKLEPYIVKAVKSAYILRGNEGMTNRSEGSIATAYEDIEEKLRNNLIKNGLRLLK